MIRFSYAQKFKNNMNALESCISHSQFSSESCLQFLNAHITLLQLAVSATSRCTLSLCTSDTVLTVLKTSFSNTNRTINTGNLFDTEHVSPKR